MTTIQSDITIIGGGLTGLTLAYLLRDTNCTISIVEARTRLGGRIHTKYSDERAPQEMGATWLGQQHSVLSAFLQALGIGIFEQILGDTAIYEPISTSPPQLVKLPPNTNPSYRIQGGTSMLIQTLAKALNAKDIYTNQVVESIEKKEEYLIVKSNNFNFKSTFVVSTLPPFLLTNTIKINPELPDSLLNIAQKTHTWMGESIKVCLTFEQPFWRSNNSSGTIFSNVGSIPEMYDHSNYEDNKFALKGFLNGAYFSLSKEERLALVLQQLRKYFGQAVDRYLTYEETVWRNEPFTFAPYPAHVLPHQNNGHSIYQQTFLNDQFFIAGAETSPNFPGYMEGAIQSAQLIYKVLNEGFSSKNPF